MIYSPFVALCSKGAGESRKKPKKGDAGWTTSFLAVAGGQQPADVVIANGKIVNVLTAEIYDGGVAISDQTIATVGDVDYCIGEGTQVVDAQGMFITPGFIDGHIHPKARIWPFAPLPRACSSTAPRPS